MTSDTLTESRTTTNTRTDTTADVVGKSTITMMAGVSAVVGVWAVTTFVGGLLGSGGPLAMIQSWFGAVTGM